MDNYHTIVTHENPDLDAIMSVLLMQTFGEKRFPGISSAEVKFLSANKLQGSQSARDLEKEGIIPVDIGGGRFDTHPDGTKVDKDKLDRSATDLVAEYLGVLKEKGWEDLIEYTRMHDSKGHALFSSDQVHHLITIQTILLGLQYKHKLNYGGKLTDGQEILRCINSFVLKYAEVAAQEQDELMKKVANAYFDAHPEKEEPWFKRSLQWLDRVNKDEFKAYPEADLDYLICIKAISIGAYLRFDQSLEKMTAIFSLCFDAILLREKQWHDALVTIKQARIQKIGRATIALTSSENGLVIKAARYKYKADLTIYHNPKNGAISFLLRNYGALKPYILKRLAAIVRIAESLNLKEEVDYNELEAFGEVNGWFFHQSGNFLLKGSLKSEDFIPTSLSLDELFGLSIAEVAMFLNTPDEFKFPEKFNGAISQYKLQNAFFKR